MGIVDGIKRAVSKVANAVGHAFSSAANEISSDAHAVASTVKNALGEAHDDAKALVKGVADAGNKVVDDVDGLANSTLSALKMPLILLSGGVLLFLMSSGKNSHLNADAMASYNR